MAGGGELLRQVLAAGLLDQLELHIVPVLLGDGQRLFDPSLGLGPSEGIELVPTRVIETPELTHIRYTRHRALEAGARRPGCQRRPGRTRPAGAVRRSDA